jgi:transposase
LALADWLASHGCTHIAMESTGVYWRPVWHILEEQMTFVLANATHIRHIPGRKSDVSDATWIADLLAHGLIRGSFVPPAPIQELRDLTRTRKQLVRAAAQHTQRIQKVLADANVKLASVVSNVLGKSGRSILDALVAGERDPERLVQLASSRLAAPRSQLVEAVHGRVSDHHCFLLKLHLTQIDAIEDAVRTVETRVGELLPPFQRAVDHLLTIPGVSDTACRVILAEIGSDMARFPTAGHLLSWAGLCPRLWARRSTSSWSSRVRNSMYEACCSTPWRLRTSSVSQLTHQLAPMLRTLRLSCIRTSLLRRWGRGRSRSRAARDGHARQSAS